ncbi:MAG: sodium:solute symporter [Candidatus Acidiferrales bacterium]
MTSAASILVAGWINPAVIGLYLAVLLVLGLYFSRRQTTTESYFVARRSVPGWAMGISLLATMITSVTFVAYPGAAYAGDWSLIMPGVMILAVPVVAGFVIVPFYRHAIGMSAFEYFGDRFGRPVRVYSALMFGIGHLAKMGFVFYLLALTVNSITGWSVGSLLLLAGVVAIVYALVGGLEAVIWADVLQAILLGAGVVVAVGYLLFLPPGGPSHALSVAWQAHKFGLGSTALTLRSPGLLVLLLYGTFFYLQKYTADQSVVQRYLSAKSDRAALRGILLGAGLCLPVWALFMLIGTLLWSYYHISGEHLPAYVTKGDQVFPYFFSTHLPPGVAGLFLAALFGAAMAMLSSDLNCLAMIIVEDGYRMLRPASDDARRLRVGRTAVVGVGAVALGVAWTLAHSEGTALALYYGVLSVVAGGLAGLFLLAFLCTAATRRAAEIGIAANLIFTLWATLTASPTIAARLHLPRFTWHEYMIGVVGNVILLGVGYVTAVVAPGLPRSRHGLTLWTWLERRESEAAKAEAVIS